MHSILFLIEAQSVLLSLATPVKLSKHSKCYEHNLGEIGQCDEPDKVRKKKLANKEKELNWFTN